MQLKLAKTFIPISIIIISISCGILFAFILIDTKNTQESNRELKEIYLINEVNDKTKLIHQIFKTIQPTINTVTTKIHSQLKKANIETIPSNNKTKNIATIYEDYTYNYIVYSKQTYNSIKYNYKFSTINNKLLLNQINTYSKTILRTNKQVIQKLNYNQIANKIVRLQEEIYLISFNNIASTSGESTGVIVVLIPFNNFIQLNNFTSDINNKSEIKIFDAYNKECIFTNTADYINADDSVAKTAFMNNGEFLNKIDKSKNNNMVSYSISMLYEPLNLIINTKIHNSSVDYYSGIDYKSIILMILIVLLIIMIVIFMLILKHYYKRNNATLNDIINLLESILNGNNDNTLGLICNIKNNTNRNLWKNYNDTVKWLDNIEQLVIEKQKNLEKLNNEIPLYAKNIISRTVPNFNINIEKTVNELEKLNSYSTISNLSEHLVILKRNITFYYSYLNKFNDVINNYKEISDKINRLSSDFTILCNRNNDSRLNEILLTIKKINNKMTIVNASFNEIYSNKKFEENEISKLYSKINHSIELIVSNEKKRNNILQNTKQYIEINTDMLNNLIGIVENNENK